MKTTARNRFGALLAATALVTLTACSNDDPGATPAPTPSESASESADPTDTPSDQPSASPTPGTPEITAGDDGRLDYCKDQKTPFTGDAAKKFGPEKVMDAYCSMVTLTMEQTWVPDLLRKRDNYTTDDFSFARDLMTTDARKDWDTAVKGIVNHEPGHLEAVASLMFFGVVDSEGKYEYLPEEDPTPTVVHQKFTAAQTWIDNESDDGNPRLAIQFTVSADIVQADVKTGDLVIFPTSKKMTYYLDENGTHPTKPWLIDAWVGEYDIDPVKKIGPNSLG